MSVASPNRVVAPLVDEVSPVHTQAEMATTMPQHPATRNNTPVYFSVGPNEPDIHWRAQQFANDGRLKLAIAQMESSIDDILNNISQRMLAHPAPDNDTIKTAIESGFGKYRKTIRDLLNEPNVPAGTFNITHFVTHLGRGKHLLEQLSITLRETRRHFNCIMTNMMELAASMVHCSAAVANSLKQAQQNLSLNAGALKHLFIQQREHLFMQLLIQYNSKLMAYIQKNPEHVRYEIHIFNMLFNLLAPRVNLQPIEDEVINRWMQNDPESISQDDEEFNDVVESISEALTEQECAQFCKCFNNHQYVEVFCSELSERMIAQIRKISALAQNDITHRTIFQFEHFTLIKNELAKTVHGMSEEYGLTIEFNDFIWAYGDNGFTFPFVPPRLFCKITQELLDSGLRKEEYNLDIPGFDLLPLAVEKQLRLETQGGWLWLKTIQMPSATNPSLNTTLNQPSPQHWQTFLSARHISQADKASFLARVLYTCAKTPAMTEALTDLFAELLRTRQTTSRCMLLKQCFSNMKPVLEHQELVHELALDLTLVPKSTFILKLLVPHIKKPVVLSQIAIGLIQQNRAADWVILMPLCRTLQDDIQKQLQVMLQRGKISVKHYQIVCTAFAQ